MRRTRRECGTSRGMGRSRVLPLGRHIRISAPETLTKAGLLTNILGMWPRPNHKQITEDIYRALPVPDPSRAI